MQNYPNPFQDNLKTMVYVTYGLFIVGIFMGGFPAIAGVVLAYIKRDEALGTIYHSHFLYLIRTFWVSTLIGLLGVLLSLIFVGIFVIIAVSIWYIFRVIYGAVRCYEQKEVNTQGYFM